MPTLRPWTDDDDQRMVDLHAAGYTLTAIAKELGRSTDTIHKYSKRAGLSWDRSKTAAATEAKKIDVAARRVALEERYLAEALQMLDNLHAPTIMHSFGGKDNVHNCVELDKPLYADQRNIAQASATMANAANRLRDMTVDSEASAVDQWVGDMLGRPKPTSADSPEIGVE